MKIIKQFAVIVGFYFAGELICILTGVPIPGSVIGMILMFLALASGKLLPEHIRTTSDFLLDNFTLLFIPPTVGLMDAFDLLKAHIVAILIIVFAGTFFTVLLTGFMIQKLIGGVTDGN